MNRRLRPRVTLPLLAAGLGLLLLGPGCGSDAPTAPGAIPLRVNVVFAPAASDSGARVPSPVAAVDRIRAVAYEVQGDSKVARASASTSIGAADVSFELRLSVPAAPLYDVQVSAFQGQTLLYAGDAYVEDVRADTVTTATVVLEPASLFLPPAFLVADVIGYNSVLLLWADQGSGATSYEIQREDPGATSFRSLRTVKRGTSFIGSYVDTVGIAADADYTYRVRGTGGTGVSDFSNESMVHTPGPADRPACRITPPFVDFSQNPDGPLTVNCSFDVDSTGAFVQHCWIDTTVTVHNDGDQTLSATLHVDCPYFSLPGGNPSFRLLPGESRSFTLRTEVFGEDRPGFVECALGVDGCDAGGALIFADWSSGTVSGSPLPGRR